MAAQGASASTRRSQKLLMGPWSHAVNAHSKLGEVDFGSSAIIDLEGYQLRWFDHWLRGADTGLLDEPPVRLFLMGANRWMDAAAWPPPDAQPDARSISTAAGGPTAATAMARSRGSSRADEPPDGYHYDPARPVPFITEPTSAQIGGPDDYAAIERRDDVLVYTTAPLDADLTVIGPIRMELYAASSAPDTDFMVKLLDVHPSGFAQRLCDSMVRARYRAGFTDPTPIPPGEVVHYSIDLWNTAHVFLKGHRPAPGNRVQRLPQVRPPPQPDGRPRHRHRDGPRRPARLAQRGAPVAGGDPGGARAVIGVQTS